MKHIVLRIVMLALFAVGATGCKTVDCSPSSEFFLVDSEGQTQGPFQVFHEDALTIDGKDYSIYIPEVAEAKNTLIQKMKRVNIPDVNFRQAHLIEAVEFLHEKGLKDISPGTLISVKYLGAPESPLITFAAKDITMWETIRIVCKVADLDWRIVGSETILFVHRSDPDPIRIRKKVQQTPAGDVLKAAPEE